MQQFFLLLLIDILPFKFGKKTIFSKLTHFCKKKDWLDLEKYVSTYFGPRMYSQILQFANNRLVPSPILTPLYPQHMITEAMAKGKIVKVWFIGNS